MNARNSSKLPFLIVAGVGAIGGALSVLLARKESREYIRERGAKGFEYMQQTGTKLRSRTEGIIEKGRELMSGCCASAKPEDQSARHPEHGDEIH